MPAIIIRGYIFTFTTSDFCDETFAKLTGAPWRFGAASSSMGMTRICTLYCGVAPSTWGRSMD
jgi:hypothetical protein